MISLGIILTFAIRVGLVLLFLPFSALDKLLNFKGAVAQAREVAPSRMIAVGLIVAGLCVEVFMSLGVVTGIADRACAFVLAGYCAVTALLWKQFWKPGDFWASNTGQGRTLTMRGNVNPEEPAAERSAAGLLRESCPNGLPPTARRSVRCDIDVLGFRKKN
jgi:uncharacterized membrane protein YphA (DoxX/SURF4 family)